MDDSRYRKILTALFAVFLSLPFCIVTAAIRFGPSGQTQAVPEFLLRWHAGLIVLVLPASFFLFLFLLSRKNLRVFIIALIASITGMMVLTIGFSLYVHRDFFTATFQYILCLPVIMLFFLWAGNADGIPRKTFRTLSTVGFVLAILYSEWIMLMGYSISTRVEPRPIESMVHNSYNLVLVFILFLLSRGIARKNLHTIVLGNKGIRINGRDSTTLFGHKKLSIFHALAANGDRTLGCPALQVLLKTQKADLACDRCAHNQTKATQCPGYRNIYNQVLDIKKLLEFLEIGTITSSANKREILSEGWKLQLFENVRVMLQK